MPAWLHRELEKSARKKRLKGKRKNSYVYGALREYEKKKSKKPKGGSR